MDLFLMLILIGAVAVIIVSPLFRRSASLAVVSPKLPADGPRTRLALTAIKELEFDYATGKIDDDDYRALRTRYDARAVEALEHPVPATGETAQQADDATAQLEAEIRAVRGRRFCTNCGGPVPKTARFCPACGTSTEVKA